MKGLDLNLPLVWTCWVTLAKCLNLSVPFVSSSVKWRKQYCSCRVAGDDQLMLIRRKDHSRLERRPEAPLVLLGVLPPALGLWNPHLGPMGVGLAQAAKKHIFGMTHL